MKIYETNREEGELILLKSLRVETYHNMIIDHSHIVKCIFVSNLAYIFIFHLHKQYVGF